ncbi:uncharacterized protein LOC142505887 isoform X1 [Primulina tabacum]|uniref:uncharacterized protein LOC142505887 isoform X1 n=1 Tax=Primulina tabacum TaxID=48773 RepID=UPI003F59C6FD
MKEKSWVCTLVTQLSLCIAVYVALNKGGRPEKRSLGISAGQGRPVDVYFASVGGGFRPLEEQTLLLEQMVKAVETYKVQFVINISELGEYDPLLKNASWHPELREIPWYTTVTTKASKGEGKNYFVDRIRIPYGQTLDIIALDTKLVQNPSTVPGKDQLQWLMRTLNKSDVDWKLVVGFHQLFTYDYNIQKIKEQETTSRPLLSTLLRYGVDAYMSSLILADHVQREATQLTNIGPTDKGPYFISLNQNIVPIVETDNGFLLHSVTSLEMVTFFVTLTGEVENMVSFRQMGRAVM